MAKIIDFKTRTVLVDLPSVETPRIARVWRIVEIDSPPTLSGIISNSPAEAQERLQEIKTIIDQTIEKTA
jgi:hypothetical protein